MNWIIEAGRIFKDSIGTKLTVLSTENGKVNYTTQYDDLVRYTSINTFRNWIEEEIGKEEI